MPHAGAIRLILGLCQGATLYVLVNASQLKTWPASNGPLFAALIAAAVCAPFVVISGLSYVRPRLLAGWALAVVVLCAGTAWYAIVRDPVSGNPDHVPPPPFWAALIGGLFAAHCLLVAGAIDRRRIARYITYFDVSWKFGVQGALALAFTGAFWLLLMLGVQLFKLIRIDLPQKVVQEQWFWIPATTMALSCALHVTDVRVGIVRGVRTLSCTLLSWLLPLLTLIVAGFLIALLFTGLEPLWSTRYAATILLAAAAGLIFLINAAYQDGTRATGDGTAAQPMQRVLSLAMLVASAALLPLTALAGYAVVLRVQQYGWTPERVFATAAVTVAACYAVGYAVAVVRWRWQFIGLERVNIATSFVILAVLLALFTPIADPARISVADQVARLNAGKTQPERFDYQFLRFRAGRYGTDALRVLAAQNQFPVAAQRAATALDKNARPDTVGLPALTPAERAANLTVHPDGKSLPRDFLETDWNGYNPSYVVPVCLKLRDKCDAILIDLDGNRTDEIILLRPGASRAWVFRGNSAGAWDYSGEIANVDCGGARSALLAGHFSLVATTSRDIEVAGQRLHVNVPADCRLGLTAIPKQ